LDGFQVREKLPEPTTPRAKLAKRIKTPKQKDDQQDSEQLQARKDPTAASIPRDWEIYHAVGGNLVLDKVSNANLGQAEAVRADVARRYHLPDEEVRIRSVPTEQSAERARALARHEQEHIRAQARLGQSRPAFAGVQDLEPDVSQNFPDAQGTQLTVSGVPSWEIYDNNTNQVVRTFFQRDLQDAMVYAGQWLEANDLGLEGYTVRPAMEITESADLERKLNQLLKPTDLEQDPKYRRDQLRQRQLAYSRKQNLRQVEPDSGWPKTTDPIDEAQRWPDIESAKRAFVANPRYQHLPVSTRQAMAASAYLKQQSKSSNLADRLKLPPVKSPHEVDENFADGKKPGRKGLSKRMGVNTKASVSSLRRTAKHSTGEKARMAHWLANMKAGRAKAKKK